MQIAQLTAEKEAAEANIEALNASMAAAQQQINDRAAGTQAAEAQVAQLTADKQAEAEASAALIYQMAGTFKSMNAYKDAKALYEQLGDYLDSAEQAARCADKIAEIREQSFTVRNYVTFGSYEQDNNLANGAEPIEWLVLAREGDKALLISRYVLDAKPYHAGYESVTWQDCTLREWLNNEFINAAFTNAEQNAILMTDCDNSCRQSYSGWRKGSNDTQDKIFLLSYHEAFVDYFWGDRSRKCVPTAYAKAQGAVTSSENFVAGQETCYWWTRSNGETRIRGAVVFYDGSRYQRAVDYCRNGVRPAIWVNIESGQF